MNIGNEMCAIKNIKHKQASLQTNIPQSTTHLAKHNACNKQKARCCLFLIWPVCIILCNELLFLSSKAVCTL